MKKKFVEKKSSSTFAVPNRPMVKSNH